MWYLYQVRQLDTAIVCGCTEYTTTHTRQQDDNHSRGAEDRRASGKAARQHGSRLARRSRRKASHRHGHGASSTSRSTTTKPLSTTAATAVAAALDARAADISGNSRSGRATPLPARSCSRRLHDPSVSFARWNLGLGRSTANEGALSLLLLRCCPMSYCCWSRCRLLLSAKMRRDLTRGFHYNRRL